MAHSAETSGSDFALDRGSDVPLGTQLAWRLRSLIASGRLVEGERLPGVREMAGMAGVNVNTVRTVYARLGDQGVIVSEHGRGTFVADRRPAQDELGRLAAQTADSAREAGIDPRELAAALYSAERGAKTSTRDDEAGASHAFAAEARRRAALRTEIAALERELALLEVPGATEPSPEPDARRRQAPQILTAADLERVRDDLAARLAPLRADRNVARTEREQERRVTTEPVPEEDERRPQRAITTSAPHFEPGSGGGWSLRWSG